MASWHYANTPYNPEGIALPPQAYVEGEDVVWALEQCFKTFDFQSEVPEAAKAWLWSFQLRALMHFVGDIHQPLHNAQLFSSRFPDGDEGGNL